MLWQVLSETRVVAPEFISSPSAIAQAGVAELSRQGFWTDVSTSAVEFVTGYVAAVIFGVPLGLALGWYRRLAFALEPMLNFLYATPRVALLPLVVLIFGIAISSKIVIVFLGAWVTILLNTYLGVRTVEPKYTAVGRAFGASQTWMFTSVVFPSSVPFILAGMRLGIGRALIGVVVAELYGSNEGIGNMIQMASNNYQVDRMLFAVALLILLGLGSVAAIQRLGRIVAPWRADLARE